ncbi:hypothetical protein JKF63_02111 [Porcisia hertigi]|uniref:Uncharacterized protein n=1 Tax=Porcisia hertigi TaxID=2761500 RepID=A0A836II53_9TRYP|nr:hypothetical protein JKF63_02111 [Porcisia hertigi]
MSQRYEDAVLKGTALLLFDLPLALRNAVQPLHKLFDSHYPNNGITRILLNQEPIRSTSGENVMECGAVFFSSPEALWRILDRVRVLLRTEDGELELRRGYLTLGVQEVLVEGVVTWGAKGRQRPTSALTTVPLTPAPTTASRSKISEGSSVSPRASAVATQPVPASVTPPTTASSAVPDLENKNAPASHGEMPMGSGGRSEGCQTVVVVLLFKEIYNRHRDSKEENTNSKQVGASTSFPLSPFMVYQMLVGVCQPRKIVLIESQRAAAKRESRALVELESAEVAAHVIRVFTRRAVEFVSESHAYKVPEHSRKPPEKGPLPICAEVRYYVNCAYSVRNGQSLYLPNGNRNYHRTVAVRPFCPSELDLTDPRSLARLQAKAPREWQPDPHAIRPASIPDRESPNRAEVCEEKPRHLQPSSTAVQHKRCRSPPPRGRSACPSTSRSHSVASSSTSSHRRRRHRGHHSNHRGSDDDRHDARASPARKHGHSEAAAAVSAPVPETDLSAESQPIAAAGYAQSPSSPQTAALLSSQLQKVQGAYESVSATPAPPAVTYDNFGALPVGWRPIFSQEYQQTYYAYRDPNTGLETTTWERPAT